MNAVSRTNIGEGGKTQMTSDSFYSLIDLAITAGGVYVIFATLMMMKTGVLKQNGLMPGNTDIKKCKDTAGYIKFIGPKQLGFGILLVLCGGVGLIQDYTDLLGGSVYLISMLLVLAYIFFLSVQAKKALRMFW